MNSPIVRALPLCATLAACLLSSVSTAVAAAGEVVASAGSQTGPLATKGVRVSQGM
jgi:hypothetical protein